MHFASQLPELAFVRVLTAGGPYAKDDILSVAFASPLVGRLAPHAPRADLSAACGSAAPLVPESISAEVVRCTRGFAEGDVLTLSFVDPSVARIHPAAFPATSVTAAPQWNANPDVACEPAPEQPSELPSSAVTASLHRAGDEASEAACEEPGSNGSGFMHVAPSEPTSGISLHTAPHGERGRPSSERTGVRVRLQWTADRARRFVRVVDKLFTVDRLGWYRHVLAMRLLVPDEITTGDALSDIEAMRHLHALRAASVETLGRPVLAALMPNFAVTHDWLDALDSVAAARAVAGLRDAIAPHVDDTRWPSPDELDAGWTVGTVEREEFRRSPVSSVEALLPILIPSISPNVPFSKKLAEYRHALGELFGQTAQCADAVRLNAMSQPNHSLDDRLWQLVGIVGDTFGTLAIA